MNLSSEKIKQLKQKGKQSLFFFAFGILGFKDFDKYIHRPICQQLQNYAKNTRIKVVLPRDWFKSTMVSVAYPLWRAVNDPNVRLLITQNSYNNATKKLQAIKQIVEKNALFRALYPEVLPNSKCRWTKECLEFNRDEVHPEGTIEAAGTGTATTSRHYDVIIEDDTVVPDVDAMGGLMQQPTAMDIEKAIGWHKVCHPMLLHPSESQIIVVGTRWAERDLLSWLSENAPNYLTITRAVRENAKGEPATPENGGKAVWERFNDTVLDELASDASIGPYMFACTPDWAPVLMANFQSKPICDVCVGDTVVGFELGEKYKNAKTVETDVIAKGSRKGLVVKLLMSSGREVFCTPDHKWLVDPHHKSSRPHLVYRSVCKIGKCQGMVTVAPVKAKNQLHYVCTPYVSKFVQEKDSVVAVEVVGEQEVYWLQTGTGNYISQGYASKNSLYMNNPTDAVNQVFKRDWIQYYVERPQNLAICMSVDPAQSDKEQTSDPDYSIVEVTGVEPKSGNIYVLDYVRERFNPGELVDAIFNMYRVWKPLLVKIEAIAYQRTLSWYIRKRMEQLNIYFTIDEIKSLKGSKVDRIRGLQPYFSAGKIFIKATMPELERELLSFPKGAHDDIIDALCMQIEFWYHESESYEKAKIKDRGLDPFTGEGILRSLLGRAEEARKFPYDIGHMRERISNTQLRSYAYAS